jgi:hypothetical protein
MSHPFTKMLEKALLVSTEMDNRVFVEARKILEKGYREAEVVDVLRSMRSGRIDDFEVAIIDEAIEEITEAE